MKEHTKPNPSVQDFIFGSIRFGSCLVWFNFGLAFGLILFGVGLSFGKYSYGFSHNGLDLGHV